MNMLCFVLWMLGYPLVCSIGSYLSYLSEKRYSVQVISNTSEIYLYDNAQMLTDDEIKQFLSGE